MQPIAHAPLQLRLRLIRLGFRVKPNSIESFDVFLSHSSRDKDIVGRLASRLRAAGLAVWLDGERIRPGDNIVEQIESGLRSSRFVIVCLSKALAQSNWVRREYGPLLHREVTQRRRRVIPVQLEPVEDDEIPILLYDNTTSIASICMTPTECVNS